MKRASQSIALLLFRGYKFAISPWIGGACRYQPTCSEFAVQAIAVHGIVHGTFMAMGRIARCHPLGGYGYDPVKIRTSDSAA